MGRKRTLARHRYGAGIKETQAMATSGRRKHQGETTAAKGNRQYKDRLFVFLFGSAENKAWTLDLYNAVNHSHHRDPGAIEIATFKDIMYLGIRNDISFLIANEINLYEQQSTYNPNMPLRLLQYAANAYEKYITQRNLNKYSSRLLPLPVPKLVTFYNGMDERPEAEILRLSNSFPKGSDPDIDVRVKMLNINAGKNRWLLEACKPLGEYAWLVGKIRKNHASSRGSRLDNAIDKAITTMPKDFMIRPFLAAHRAEVKGMLMTEYDETRTMELFREEGREEGIFDTLRSLVQGKLLSVSDAAATAGISEEAFLQRMRGIRMDG